MSSGARVWLPLISETTPGVTPTTGAWDTLRLTNQHTFSDREHPGQR